MAGSLTLCARAGSPPTGPDRCRRRLGGRAAAELDPTATPGLVEGGHEFYTEEGAFALRDVLAGFEGGRVIVGVCSTPFKCPPAPSETALLVHDLLTGKGVRERSEVHLVMPLPVPIPPSPPASEALLGAFAERGIEFHPATLVRGLDPERRVALLGQGDSASEMPYDLFLGVPKHHVPAVVAEGQAGVVADRIIAQARGEEGPTYGGVGVCYLEFGGNQVAGVEVTFLQGQAPFGTYAAPSEDLAAVKATFGTSRIRRWFGREWSAH